MYNYNTVMLTWSTEYGTSCIAPDPILWDNYIKKILSIIVMMNTTKIILINNNKYKENY